VEPVAAPVHRLESLTGLRWIAAMAVLGFHLAAGVNFHDKGADRVLGDLFGSGYTGVSLFFLLSGLVLTWSATTGDTPARFYRRRFARVVPNHVAATIIACLLSIVVGTIVVHPGPLLAQLLLVQAWFPSARYYYGVSIVTWSLSCELLFYALFPLVFSRLAALSTRGRRGVLLAVLVGLALYTGMASAVGVKPFTLWAVNFFPLARAAEFAVGILLGLELRAGTWPRLPFPGVLALAAAAYLWAWRAPVLVGRAAVTLVPFALLLGALVQRELAGRRSWLARRPLVALGDRSYALYLLHVLVLLALLRIATPGSLHEALFLTVALVAASLVASHLMFVLVERPAQRRLRPKRVVAN
jgi:peptidoglycan/LPS O-acetylase OafA/YrhL